MSKPSYEMEAVHLAVQNDGRPKKEKVSLLGGCITFNRPENLRWLAVQIGIWLFLVATITFTPVMMRLSFYTSAGTTAAEKYAPPTVHVFSFLLSIVIGLSISVFLYGTKAFRDVFNIRAILLLAPVSIGYAGSEALALFAMRSADPIMYAVIHKMRLLETAVMTRVFLRRKISALQWVICLTVTMCVLAFVLYTVADKAGQKSDPLGPVLLIINITVSVACSIYADWSYKKLGYPLPLQIPTGRITATLGSLLIGVSFISAKGWWQYGWFGGPEGGWDWRVILLLFYNIIRDWTTCFVLMYLDALWKALAGSTAVATTYVADVLIFGKNFVPTLMCLVLAIVFAVAIYAMVKVSEKALKQAEKEKEDLLKRLSKYSEAPDAETTAA